MIVKTTILGALALTVALGSVPALGADALDKMALVFEGNPSRTTIATHITAALQRYGLENTEDNRLRLGSVLVRMRKEYGVSEMDILRCMISADLGEFSVSAPEAAAICTATLEAQPQ